MTSKTELINQALAEDIGLGDHTSLATIPEGAMGRAVFLAREKGILAGMETAKQVYKTLDRDIIFHDMAEDGSEIFPGSVLGVVEGKARSILGGERLSLNFMQRLSGIATFTRSLVDRVSDLPVTLLDTRKTTPNMRIFEKEAVKTGGGFNHRMGLYDLIMIKDNHIDFAGGIEAAIKKTQSYLRQKNLQLKVEIEVRNFDELSQVLTTGGINRIMLDNFSVEDLKKAVGIIGGRYETEASGGINETTIRAYAETGVDYISVGALTHQIKSLDISLKADFMHATDI